MDIPSEADWRDWPSGTKRPYQDEGDEDYARERFAGKSLEAALQLFQTFNVSALAEDLDYMPPVPFRFYMGAFKSYVLTEIESSDWNVDESVVWFLSLVERKLQTERVWIAPIMADLMPAMEFVVVKQQSRDASLKSYDNFREQLERIKTLWGA